jgi:hypothetical protein
MAAMQLVLECHYRHTTAKGIPVGTLVDWLVGFTINDPDLIQLSLYITQA